MEFINIEDLLTSLCGKEKKKACYTNLRLLNKKSDVAARQSRVTNDGQALGGSARDLLRGTEGALPPTPFCIDNPCWMRR